MALFGFDLFINYLFHLFVEEVEIVLKQFREKLKNKEK